MSLSERYSVAVIMQRTQVQRGLWSVASWGAVSVVADEHIVGKPGVLQRMREGDAAGSEQFLQTGLVLELHRDLAEEYWYNLTSDNPSLFIICHESPDGGLQAFRVTADFDSSAVCLESDDQVFAVPIPAEIYPRIEAFVVNHFVPRERVKRKRKNWSETAKQ